ncbi:TonB-dependent receptor domain-containing protein [Caulobacter sp. RHG1]|uniref:TonB-dependent receptor domain-containing protein n=1 Tax=Caulobacter sp. (strain RHG1) TaxID=2545762 RepID=UPI001555E174|nr:TonB-dependent receptor [Caulobacter sp. RHG1]NQE61354.1 TonB-dependent receptor [Caulobacter sp. RHG1]
MNYQSLRGYRRRLAQGAALAGLLIATGAAAQESIEANNVEEVVVVGTQIKGAKTTAALPVTVLDESAIAATGAVSGDDLFRSIPQMGDVFINPSNSPQTSNSTRGDVNSINLRSLGVGNTLVLLNGRRLVSHPTSQSSGTVPLLGFNANAIPTSNLDRLEVLRDGAAAIYGSDAVAGVVNTVLKSNFDGLSMDAQYGWAEGTHRKEYSSNIFAGRNFAEGRGNISVNANFTWRTAQRPSDRPYTATQDLRPLFAGYADYAASAAPDNRGNQNSFANFTVFGGPGVIRQGTTALTTAAGATHVQPNTIAGCAAQLANGLCLGTGNLATGSTANAYRYNAPQNDATTIAPEIKRQNLFLNGHYDISDTLTAYGEVGFYHATSEALTTQGTSLVVIGVPASNYWNPFGPVTFANGQANPNRLANLTNVPAAGLPVTFTNYRFNDLGPNKVEVENYQTRFLGGLKGEKWGWSWDSALLYSKADAKDESDGIDSAKLAASLALSTPDAYNPFNGGCLDGRGGGDCTPSSKAALDAIRFRLKRHSTTTLTLADFKVSKPDLVNIWAGPVGVAAGVEFRHETQEDRRDPMLDGRTPFTDPVTGNRSASNVTGVNDTPSTKGSRDVGSAFLEFAVPLVSPEMNIPLVRRIDLQLAGRYENYSDFGSVAKPKIAFAWDVIDGVRFRGSWQQGFRAPNLETTNPFNYSRTNTVTDYYRCEADLRSGRIATFTACTRGVGIRFTTAGNPDLKAEESENYSVGVVLQPTFIPEQFGRFTFTVDRWQIKQEGIVGTLGSTNIAIQDYLFRLSGASNPAVIRSAPTVDDVAAFAGTGLTPVGQILEIRDQFKNLQPQTVSGIDFGLNWSLRTESVGRFTVNVDGTYMDKYSQQLAPPIAELFAARSAGTINPATPLTDPGDLLKRNGKPKWKWSGNATWRGGPFQVGASVIYTGSVLDTDFLSTAGEPWRVQPLTTVNLYGQYRFEQKGWANDTRIRVGARNLFDKDPPLSSGGFIGSLYNPYARYWYMSVSKSF